MAFKLRFVCRFSLTNRAKGNQKEVRDKSTHRRQHSQHGLLVPYLPAGLDTTFLEGAKAEAANANDRVMTARSGAMVLISANDQVQDNVGLHGLDGHHDTASSARDPDRS
jgi:hypothetical protein